MPSTTLRIANAWPLRQLHRAIDGVELKWFAWRTYNRARTPAMAMTGNCPMWADNLVARRSSSRP